MKTFHLPKKVALLLAFVGLSGVVPSVYSQVNEMTGEIINEVQLPESGGMPGESRTELVLHQRISERELSTERGVVSISPAVKIVDSRPVDSWYLQQDAKVTFVFMKDKMVRVEIRN